MSARQSHSRSRAGRSTRIALTLVSLFIVWATLRPLPDTSAPVPSVWCMTCGTDWLTDWFANVLLFLPWGATFFAYRRSLISTATFGALLSLSIEVLQATGVTTGRSPSVADWTANLAGAIVGALLLSARGRLQSPTDGEARRLAGAWSAVLCLVFIGTTWAMTPATDRTVGSIRNGEPLATTSALLSPPGFGWFAGTVDSVAVNAQRFVHRGTGPVMLAIRRGSPAPDSLSLAVHVHGSDERSTVIPLLYMHRVDEKDALVLLAQRGRSVLARARRRGETLGLRPVDVVVTDRSTESHTVRRIDAQIARGMVSVKITSDPARPALRQEALLTPALGWLLIQPVVSTGTLFAPLLTALWLAFWFFGGGWWSGRAWGTVGGICWTTGAFIVIWLCARQLAMPTLSPTEHLFGLIAAIAGASSAARARTVFGFRQGETTA